METEIQKTKPQKMAIKGSRPIIYLTIVFALTWLALVWFAWNEVAMYHKAKAQRDYLLKFEKLRGDIIQLDEILTMSARLAAGTGNLKWENHYRRFEQRMDDAIKEVMGLFSEAHSGKVVSDIDAANSKLVEIENQSFELIRQGRVEEARAMLFSDEYKNQKRIYLQGITKFDRHKDLYLRLERLRGLIVYLDQVLTLSAFMAAETGDLLWEKRYRRYEPELDAAIKEAVRLAPEIHSGKASSDTAAANIKLVEIENQSFELIRQGRVEEAKALLFSDDYKNQKIIYLKGMTEFAADLSTRAHTNLRKQHREAFLRVGIVFLIIPLLIIGWYVAFRVVGNWNKEHVSKVELQNEIAERNKVEKELLRMATAVEHSPSIIFITDKNGNIEYVNPKLTEVTGYTVDEVISRNPRFLKSGIRPQEDYEAMWQTILAKKEWRGEFPNKRKNGELFWVSASISSLSDEKGAISHFVCVEEDITLKKQAEEKILFLANHDALTGLPSLRLSKDRIEQAIKAAKRNQNKVALMFIDLDGFKSVNDSLGHDAGDTVLKETAARLKAKVREMDTVGRIGGDEFIIVLTNLHSSDAAAKVASKIIESVSQEIQIDSNKAVIGASVGIAIYPDNAATVDDLLKKADDIMYEVKKSGKNNFAFTQIGST